MRVCRLKAAKWKRGAGIRVLVNPRRSSALPSETCHRVADRSRVGTDPADRFRFGVLPEPRGVHSGWYRGTSLIRNRSPLGPYSSHMHRDLWWSYGGGRFLMSEVPLYPKADRSRVGTDPADRLRVGVLPEPRGVHLHPISLLPLS